MWLLFKIVNLILLFASSFAWWSYSFPDYTFLFLALIVMTGTIALGQLGIRVTRRSVYVFGSIMLLSLIALYSTGLSYFLYTFANAIPALLLFVLPPLRQRDLLDFVTKWYSIIIGLSILFYGFVTVTGMAPFSSFMPEKDGMDYIYKGFDNYYLFIRTVVDFEIFRFSGPFLEPGHLGMVSSILLFANGMNFKEKPMLWVLLLSVLLSLSLAGYVIVLLGFAYKALNTVRRVVYTLLIAGSMFVFVTKIWNEGENVVNEAIFERLEADKTKGIAGNNRTTTSTDYFFKKCMNDGTAWFGIGTQRSTKRAVGAGYKIYILNAGLVSLMAVALMYLLLIPTNSNRRFGFAFFVLLALIFWQRAYPLWYSWLLPYVLSIGQTRLQPVSEPLLTAEEKESEDADYSCSEEDNYDPATYNISNS